MAFIDGRFGSLAEIAVRDDSSAPMRGERPPPIGGFVPDVYAIDVPTTVTIVGEAKTRRDLETAHSQAQIAAFLDFLSVTANGVFILSVPLTAGATARRIVQASHHRSRRGDTTQVIVLDELT